MSKYYSEFIPQEVETIVPNRVLSYNIVEVSESGLLRLWKETKLEGMGDEPDEVFRVNHKYSYNKVSIPIGQWSRDGIVNAIIRDKYRVDEMEAITNNMAAVNAVFMQTLVTDGIIAATKYLKDSINDANTAKFKEMQEWRAMAKKVASEIIKE
jgi:hypothetical protein